MTEEIKSRALSYETLLELEKKGGKADALIRAVLEKYEGTEPRALAFYRRLTEGVIERRITLDYVIDLYASKKTEKMKRPVLLLLRLGVYQLLYMDSVPEHAAVDETVKLARKKGLSGLSGFINGVLRSVAKEKDSITYPPKDKDIVRYLEVLYSCPAWIVKRYLAQYGAERTENLLAAYQSERPLTLCLSKKADPVRLKALWRVQGITAEQSPYRKENYYIRGASDITGIPGYAEGDFFVQDVSAGIAVLAAGIREGDRVIDVCAAPGGKTIPAAEAAGETGSVTAFDLTEKKVARIRENIERLQLKNTEAEVQDARISREELKAGADVVIADLPCSGLGVLGRKSDIRYRVKEEDIAALQALQREILTVAVSYVKKGGILLYSTCTVTPEENEENRRWLTEQFALEQESVREFLPEAFREMAAEDGSVQLLCGEPEGMPMTDGFYIARFRKK